MSADQIARAADRLFAIGKMNADDRRFWVAVTCAAVIHLVLFVGAFRSSPHRIMGQKDGSEEGISIEIIDAADLRSQSSVAVPGDVPPAAKASAAEPPSPPVPDTPTPPVPTPEPQQQPEPKPQPKQKDVTASAIEHDKPDLFSLDEAAKKQSEQNATPKSKSQPQRQRDASLGAKMPDMSDFSGRSAAVARPAGITRSGENDDFGRGVIRALRQTMPSPRGVLGRVTIRFLLSDIGNLLEVQVVKGSGDPMLDQSVVFAARQSSFPLPPRGASVPDRTFLVTYIYN